MLKVFYILVPFGTSCELQMCSGRKFEGVIGVYIFSGQLAFFRRRWLFAMRNWVLRNSAEKNIAKTQNMCFFPGACNHLSKRRIPVQKHPQRSSKKLSEMWAFRWIDIMDISIWGTAWLVFPTRPSKRPCSHQHHGYFFAQKNPRSRVKRENLDRGNALVSLQICWGLSRRRLRRWWIWGHSNQTSTQMYGLVEGFPENNALFGWVI